MLNKDFTYCGGYGCRLTEFCKRFNMQAFDKNNDPLMWMEADYDEDKGMCRNFVKET